MPTNRIAADAGLNPMLACETARHTGWYWPMKFRLTYEGELPSVGNASGGGLSSTKLAAIWRIRNQLSEQLARVWETHPAITKTESRVAAAEVSRDIESEGFHFRALTHKNLDLCIALSITIAVNHEPGSLVTKTGDLDNRNKAILDALRVPVGANEFRDCKPAQPICHCLMLDDAIITDIRILAIRNYSANQNHGPTHAKVDIDVTATPRVVNHFNSSMI